MSPVISVEHLSKASLRLRVSIHPMKTDYSTLRSGQAASGTVDLGHLLYSFIFMLVVVFLGSVIFNRVEQTFMDTV